MREPLRSALTCTNAHGRTPTNPIPVPDTEEVGVLVTLRVDELDGHGTSQKELEEGHEIVEVVQVQDLDQGLDILASGRQPLVDNRLWVGGASAAGGLGALQGLWPGPPGGAQPR